MENKKLKVEIVDLSVTLFIGTQKEIELKLRKDKPDFKMGYGVTRPIKKELRKQEFEYEIYLSKDQKKHSLTSILVHELTHVVDSVLKKIGADSEKEFKAYMMGYLFENFEKIITKQKS